MASPVDIANLALSILGKPEITSLSPTDGSTAARAIATLYDPLRRKLLTGPGVWRFSIRRTSLPSLTTVPVSGPYTTMYELPADCLRILQVGNSYPGLDLTDYRLGPSDADYTQEGRTLLCDYGSPLALQYAADVTDSTVFDSLFVIYLAAEIAYYGCERLTNSDEKQQLAQKRRDDARSDAIAGNALLNPPMSQADDSWVAARMW